MPKTKAEERRQYIRLDSVFPVEIYVKKTGDDEVRFVQGFTRDVSLGGLCLSVNDPDTLFLSLIKSSAYIFDILIDVPISRKPIEASVKSAWHEMNASGRLNRLVLGVSYEDIAPEDRKRLLAMAHRIKWLPKIGVFFLLMLVALLGVSYFREAELVAKNKALIANFYRVQDASDVYKRSVNKIDENFVKARSALAEKEALITDLNKKIENIALQQSENIVALTEEKESLRKELESTVADKAALETRLKSLLSNREKAEKLYRQTDEARKELQEATTANMYSWLKLHQNKLSGLVMSFEGDHNTRDMAFTYDQALAAMAFTIANDLDRAEKILLFYKNKAQKTEGGFLNGYNCVSGSPSEYVVHVGPNVWIALAAIHFHDKTNKAEYLELAEGVARWLISNKDQEGGLKGGPGIGWYSTEHNLDAYALFNILYTVTRKDIYKNNSESTLRWIRENTYSKTQGTMKRGKGDSTIATDTMAWAIAAIGPAVLMELQMDPDGIMKFAEDNCSVTTTFTRPNGDVVKIKGFDYSKFSNAARGGIVSTEWTAQMVVSFNIMADYYFKMDNIEKAESYQKKADLYIEELDKMVISSPSPSGQGAGCLPYASQPDADTGHGWRTPRGAQTGSVAGTAYTIFARRDFNPLSIKWQAE